MAIGELVVLCDEPGQTNIRSPLIGQRSKDGLNLKFDAPRTTAIFFVVSSMTTSD
jgi:hypothetical protein